jgi:hypothetical protein
MREREDTEHGPAAWSPFDVPTPGGAALRRAYSDRGLAQIPRLLSLQDRNEFSRTYGCFHREYWLCRSVDFPSSIAQFGVHALALAYTQPFPDNPYLGNPKILLWTLAAMDYWTRIQKSDGSFDEFYPNERGWAGPTGFLVYAMCASYRLLEGHVPEDLNRRFLRCVDRAGHFLAKHDEPGVLANHHAMAILPIYEAYDLLKDPKLLAGFHVRLDDFLSYCRDEGWCLEYDGADLGYLSATVSFLGKLRKLYTDERIEGVCQRAIDFCSHFVLPSGHFGGVLGSRQTLHFYPHGFELFARENPTAAAVAEAMLKALWQGKLVPPEIQEDRYFLYRVPEMLLSWVDWGGRPETLPALPWQREPFARSWPGARMHVRKTPGAYVAVNLAKGGTFQVVHLDDPPRTTVSDAGVLARLVNGKVVTSQWIDEGHVVRMEGDVLEVEGAMHNMVMKAFTPWTMIGFRLFMLLVGWHTGMAYRIKGWIRTLLMTRSGRAGARFHRTIRFEGGKVLVTDRIERGGGPAFARVKLGDDASVRYVPQSRYFQRFELGVRGSYLSSQDLEKLNREGAFEITRTFEARRGLVPNDVPEVP